MWLFYGNHQQLLGSRSLKSCIVRALQDAAASDSKKIVGITCLCRNMLLAHTFLG